MEIALLNQSNNENHYSKTFSLSNESKYNGRPEKGRRIPCPGDAKFFSQNTVEGSYLKDNCLYFKFTVHQN